MRETRLAMLAIVSLCTLLYSSFEGHAARAVLMGCPAVVAVLATMWREREARPGRILLTIIAGIAFGQVLSVLLGPRVVDLPTFDSLSYFFLTFGVPVVALLCVVTIFAEPLADTEDADDVHDAERG